MQAVSTAPATPERGAAELSAVRSASHPLHEIDELLQWQYGRHLGNEMGEVADYIPELAKVAPNQFGGGFVTQGGELLRVGDANSPFAIQSVSKIFTFAMLLQLAGRAET